MTAPIRRPRRPDHRHLLSRLQQEWDHLAVSPAACARARGWDLGVGLPTPTTLHDVLRACGHGTDANGRRADSVVRHLLRLAADDELAARVLLQRLLPAISAMGRRHSRTWDEVVSAVDEAAATAWTVIRTSSAGSRRRYALAGLAEEIEYHAFRRRHRRKGYDVPSGVRRFDDVPAQAGTTNASAELAALLHEARLSGFPEADVDLVERLGAGDSATAIAAARDVTDRTIRNHRAIVIHRLRQLALAA